MKEHNREHKRKSDIYGNWLVLHPDGFNMFRCTTKKADWYLSRGLAKVLLDSPPTMMLTFKPNGHGWRGDSFSLNQKNNECVVCGTNVLSDLTRHHIVPLMYKKYFPKELKIASSHDVVCICRSCHDAYEIEFATQLKQKIAEEYGLEYSIRVCNEMSKAIRLAKAVCYRKDEIPPTRIEELKVEIATCMGKEKMSPSEIEELTQISLNDFQKEYSQGKTIVDKIENFQEFVERWRQHFLDSMSPKFMPKFWSVHRPVEKDLEYYKSIN